MGKGFGIAAFVLFLISLPIPILGNYLTLFAVLLLCVAALARETVWTVTVDLLAWVKMFFLSPTWGLMMFGGSAMRGVTDQASRSPYSDSGTRALMEGGTSNMESIGGATFFVTVAILAAPVVILVMRNMAASATAKRS